MSKNLDKTALFQTSCAHNTECYILQNLGTMMMPEFSDGCILIIDPSRPLHNQAYAIIQYQNETHFRQYIKNNAQPYLKALNAEADDILLSGDFVCKGIVIQQKQRQQKNKHYYQWHNKAWQFCPHGTQS